MSRSLTESLINEGIRALREQTAIKNMARSAASARVRSGAMDDFNMPKKSMPSEFDAPPPSAGQMQRDSVRRGAIDDFNMNKPPQYGNEFGPGPAKKQMRAMDMFKRRPTRGPASGLRGMPSMPPARPVRSGESAQGRLV